MWTKIIGYSSLIVAAAIIGFVMYRDSGKANDSLVFSPTQMMSALWADYSGHFLDPSSKRTLDPSRDNVTTSEGESYTMMRAAWVGDKPTFDASWQWTKATLGHQNDSLFSWLYGKRSDGNLGVLTEQEGQTSASDADTDIAMALLFAYARWQDPTYLSAARATVGDIWQYEVVPVNGNFYLASNNIEKSKKSDWILINPSYFSPAAYKIFARLDPGHPWAKLAADSYALLDRAIDSNLNSKKSAGLPPDWIELNIQSGVIRAPSQTSLTTNFGFDALRVPWRIALDATWFNDPHAKNTLQKLEFLKTQWTQGAIGSTYAHDGSAINTQESPAMYGGSIGYFVVMDPGVARHIYENKLAFLFDPGTNTWKERLTYYDDNWAWFGIGLANGLLPNLTANLPSGAFIPHE
jgi:endo-1,4-beta-D-glucanase Y